MTPIAAAKLFHAHVADQMKDGTSFDDSYNLLKVALPKLLARAASRPAEESEPDAATLGNAADRITLPADRSDINRRMKLPYDAPPEITRAALFANGGRTSPLSARDVWNAVVAKLVQTKGYSVSAAQSVAQDSYPELTRAAGQAPNNPTGVPPNWQDYLQSMGLPGNTTYDEFAACWGVTGDKPVTTNAPSVFNALVAYYVRTTAYLRRPQAVQSVAAKFPALATAAGQSIC